MDRLISEGSGAGRAILLLQEDHNSFLFLCRSNYRDGTAKAGRHGLKRLTFCKQKNKLLDRRLSGSLAARGDDCNRLERGRRAA